MKNILVVFLYVLSGVAAHKEVHLIPAHIICPKVSKDHDILIPDPKDCSIYYKCEDGYPVPNTCPPGLLWCRVLKECTLPTLAKCTIGNTVVTYSPEDLATYKPKSKEPSETENICPVDNILLPNEQNCTSFNRCVNGTPTNENCPKGMSYSCWIGACVDAAISDCLNYGSQENKTCAVNGKKLPHPEDCHKYYECLNNKVETKTCSHNFEYNQWFLECYPHEKAHCQMHGVTQPTTTSKGTTVTPSPHEPICPKPDATFPNPTDCSSYFKCNKDYKPILFHCPDNLEYSCWDKECEAPVVAECIAIDIEVGESCKNNGQKMPDPKNCNKYYECEKYTIEEKSCDNGLHYNQWFEKCDSPELAHCSVHLTTTTSTITPAPTPTPSPTEDICPIEGAKIPNELYCYSYFVCENEIAVSHNCTDGLEYSCWDQTCLPTQSANCINKQNQTGQACSKNGQKMPNPKDCTSYFECVDGIVEQKSCESELLYNKYFQNCYKADLAHCNEISSTTPTSEPNETTRHSTAGPSNPPATGASTSITTSASTPSPIDDICPMEGAKIPNEVDCHSYYVCENEVAVSYTCAGDEEYSCWDQTCLPPQSANCINKQNQTGQACSKNGQKMPNPKDCTSYFECVDGIVQQKSCESDLLYNKYFQNCYKADLAHCNEISSTTPTPEHSDTTTIGGNLINDICPIPNATLPNEADCSSFYRCIDETPILEYCPDNFDYSCWDQKCLPASEANCILIDTQNDKKCSHDGQKLPDIENCEKYYECNDGKAVSKNCKFGQGYNKWFEKCVFLLLSHCHTYSTKKSTTEPSSTVSITPGPIETCKENGETLPNPNNCSTYYECVDNKPEIQLCAGGLEYSSWEKTCLLPSDANCITQESQIGKKCKYNGQRLQNPDDCHTYYECKDNKIERKKCFLNWYYSKWFGICTPIELFAHCQTVTTITPPTVPPTTPPPKIVDDICPIADALLPNPMKCNAYYKCENEKAVAYDCPDGQGYSCWDQTCLPLSESHCIANETQVGMKCSRESARLQNVESCASYYECIKGTVQLKNCFIGFQYNKWYGKCVLPIFAHCKTSPVIPPYTTEVTPTSTNIHFTPCTDSSKKIADINNCKRYYECKNGKYEQRTCSDGLVWNCYTQTCSNKCFEPCCSNDPNASTYPHSSNCLLLGFKIPNPFTCNKYFECYRFNIVERTCSKEQTFDWLKSKCVKDSTGQCVPNIEDNTTTKLPFSTTNKGSDSTSSTGTSSPGTSSPGTSSPGTNSPGISSPGTNSPGTSSPGTSSTGISSTGYTTTSEKSTSTSTTSEKSTSTTSTTSEKPTTRTSTPTSTTTRSPSPLCPLSNNTIRYPAPSDCFGYFECQNRQLVKVKCPTGENYNCQKKICEHQDVIHCCSAPTTTTTTKAIPIV